MLRGNYYRTKGGDWDIAQWLIDRSTVLGRTLDSITLQKALVCFYLWCQQAGEPDVMGHAPVFNPICRFYPHIYDHYDLLIHRLPAEKHYPELTTKQTAMLRNICTCAVGMSAGDDKSLACRICGLPAVPWKRPITVSDYVTRNLRTDRFI